MQLPTLPTFDRYVAIGMIIQCESGHYLTHSTILYKRFTDEGKAIGWIATMDSKCHYCGSAFVTGNNDDKK